MPQHDMIAGFPCIPGEGSVQFFLMLQKFSSAKLFFPLKWSFSPNDSGPFSAPHNTECVYRNLRCDENQSWLQKGYNTSLERDKDPDQI